MVFRYHSTKTKKSMRAALFSFFDQSKLCHRIVDIQEYFLLDPFCLILWLTLPISLPLPIRKPGGGVLYHFSVAFNDSL